MDPIDTHRALQKAARELAHFADYGPESYYLDAIDNLEAKLQDVRSLGDGTPPKLSAEQQARDLLERLDVEDAQSFSSGDLVELANLIAEVERLRAVIKEVRHQAADFTPSPDLKDAVLAAIDAAGL